MSAIKIYQYAQKITITLISTAFFLKEQKSTLMLQQIQTFSH